MQSEHIAAIPAALRDMPRWVLWKSEERNGRRTKVPYALGGNRARTDAPTTWAAFEGVLDRLRAAPHEYAGLGFVFAKEDGFVGVDLDHCVAHETNALMPWARQVVELLGSYTEYSPSGAGLHIIVKGRKPDLRCKQTRIPGAPAGSAFEWYDERRFFTVSGRVFPGTPNDIHQRNGELSQVRNLIWGSSPSASTLPTRSPFRDQDAVLFERIRTSQQAARFEVLWRGDWQGAGYASQSEADLALCAMLAFWTGRDVARMDSLFRQSGLHRPKWERNAGAGQTYGARTIAAACAKCQDTLEPRRTTPLRQDLAPPDLDKAKDLDRSRELFPRRSFPWQVFPSFIAESMRQLARSCAGSPNPLPGTAFCLLGAALGRTISVLPKASWREPLIFWHLDIEESGSGKTAPMWLLAEVMKRAQAEAHERYAEEYAAWRALPRDDKHPESEPAPARGYFLTDATLEGLRCELEAHTTGGLAMLLNEASFLLNSHNQYKARGTDREAWLCLWDGHPVRVVRVGKTVYLKGARVQVCGGIQPEVFKAAFTAKKGLYLCDGTAFRCLLTFEPPAHYEQTEEVWSAAQRTAWERTLAAAMAWADQRAALGEPLDLHLAPQARAAFLDWRNSLDAQRDELPAQLRGFLPKAFSYALRLAGVLHCITAFHAGSEPAPVLDTPGILSGIDVAEFYLGQAVDAVRLLADERGARPTEVSDRMQLLAKVLTSLRPDLDNGRLAVGFIQERFNTLAPAEARIKSPHAMGAMLRSAGLSVSAGKLNANGRRSTRCLLWDQKSEDFVQTSLQTLQTLKNQSLHPGALVSKDFADNADKADIVSGNEWKN